MKKILRAVHEIATLPGLVLKIVKMIAAVAAVSLYLSCSPARPNEAALRTFADAQAAWARGDSSAALLQAEDAASRSPHFAAAIFLAGKIRFFAGERLKAEAAWRRALAAAPAHLDSRKWLARLYFLEGRLEQAEALAAEGLSLSAEDPDLLILMGRLKRTRGDASAALEYLTRARDLSDRCAEAGLELADLYRGFGLSSRARMELMRAKNAAGDGAFARAIDAALAALKEAPAL
jgi:tetratricopeptide (TPR) repeat protein